jgi:hypothetical protein
MSTFSKRMKLKADCFDPNVEIRDLARVAYAELIFESFEGKDQAYITDRALNDVLFLYAGNTVTMLSQIHLLKGILKPDDFEFFVKELANNAIVDNSYEKCRAILDAFVEVKFKVDYQRLGVLDQDKIDFLESIKDFIWIAPFFDFNFNIHRIGVAGYCKLIKLVKKDTLEFKITHEKDSGASYRYLLTGIEAGHLKDYFSDHVADVITATTLSDFLDENFDERYMYEALCKYSDSDLLRIFCNAMEVSRNRDYLAQGLRAAYKIRAKFA